MARGKECVRRKIQPRMHFKHPVPLGVPDHLMEDTRCPAVSPAARMAPWHQCLPVPRVRQDGLQCQQSLPKYPDNLVSCDRHTSFPPQVLTRRDRAAVGHTPLPPGPAAHQYRTQRRRWLAAPQLPALPHTQARAPSQPQEMPSMSWCKNNPRSAGSSSDGVEWGLVGRHLTPKRCVVRSSAYSKAFYHSVTKNLKINTKFLLNRNGKKIHKLTGKAIMLIAFFKSKIQEEYAFEHTLCFLLFKVK